MSKESNKTIVYSALEVANICEVVNQTAINWIRNGYLRAFCTPGGQYRVYLDDLVDFMTKRKMRIPEELLQYTSSDDALNILIVDDDKGLNMVLSKFFEREMTNAKITQVYNGFDAGAELAKKMTNVVLLDLNLPGVDGYDICHRINTSEKFGKPAVFVITASQDKETEDKLNKMGAQGFFKKPLDLVKIVSAVKKHLESGK